VLLPHKSINRLLIFQPMCMACRSTKGMLTTKMSLLFTKDTLSRLLLLSVTWLTVIYAVHTCGTARLCVVGCLGWSDAQITTKVIQQRANGNRSAVCSWLLPLRPSTQWWPLVVSMQVVGRFSTASPLFPGSTALQQSVPCVLLAACVTYSQRC
jgi:hypothetical protein